MKIKDQICPICGNKMAVEIVSRFGDRVDIKLQCPRPNCPRYAVKTEQRSSRELELEE